MVVKQILPIEVELPIDQLSAFRSREFPLQCFDIRAITFLDNIASRILKDKTINRIPEVAALGFWLRKSSQQKVISENSHLVGNGKVVTTPLGVIFHVCPSNVDTMFMYSLALSLLMGNKNIVRIPSRLNYNLMSRLFEHMKMEIAEANMLFGEYLNLVTYGHEENINHFLCSVADGKIVWGGDETVHLFRSFKTNPRSREIVFPDRISLSVIKSESYLEATDKAEQAELFYNDSFTFDQMGCSSPQTIVFFGDLKNCNEARKIFYEELLGVVRRKYSINDYYALASLKLNYVMSDAIAEVITDFQSDETRLMFVDSATQHIDKHSCGGGYFYIQQIDKLEQLTRQVTNKLQTLCYYGLSQSEKEFLQKQFAGRGVDRIVPLGHALNFNYLWDGYNLIEMLSKRLCIV
jgi:hypothetical protein